MNPQNVVKVTIAAVAQRLEALAELEYLTMVDGIKFVEKEDSFDAMSNPEGTAYIARCLASCDRIHGLLALADEVRGKDFVDIEEIIAQLEAEAQEVKS